MTVSYWCIKSTGKQNTDKMLFIIISIISKYYCTELPGLPKALQCAMFVSFLE